MAARTDADARARLLVAADELMYQHGYEAVGVAQLCQAADVRKGSFYHFFDSKQALALEMLDRAWSRTRRHLFAPFDDDALSADEAIERYGELLAEMLRRTEELDDGFVAGCRFGNFAAELSTRDDVIRDRIAEVFDQMVSIVASSVQRDVDRGSMPADVDARRVADDVVALMEGRMLLAKTRRDPELLAGLGAACRPLLAPAA